MKHREKCFLRKKSQGGGGGGCQAMIKLYYCHEGDWVLIMVDYVGGGGGGGGKNC